MKRHNAHLAERRNNQMLHDWKEIDGWRRRICMRCRSRQWKSCPSATKWQPDKIEIMGCQYKIEKHSNVGYVSSDHAESVLSVIQQIQKIGSHACT